MNDKYLNHAALNNKQQEYEANNFDSFLVIDVDQNNINKSQIEYISCSESEDNNYKRNLPKDEGDKKIYFENFDYNCDQYQNNQNGAVTDI